MLLNPFKESLLKGKAFKVWQVSFAMETFMPKESLQSVILNYVCPKASIGHKIRKYQGERDLKDHLVQPFLTKIQARQDGAAPFPDAS